MALYQSAQFIDLWTDPEFDKIHPPYRRAPFRHLPLRGLRGGNRGSRRAPAAPIHAHPHRLGTKEAWQMIVYADHRQKPG
ncbi:hypothetical protein RAA17_23630 [Komagataeibacter rhaeticus]|nr:hypothetical protein [Komagataeibacter rhaeticus]